MISDTKTKNFIKNKLLKSPNLNPVYEKQLTHLLELLEEYDSRSQKTAVSSSSSSRQQSVKKPFLSEIPKPIPPAFQKPYTSLLNSQKISNKNPTSTSGTSVSHKPSLSDFPFLKDPIVPSKKSLELPKVSAKSWAILEASSSKLLKGCAAYYKREVASLTKIMTLYAVLTIIDRISLDSNDIFLTVTREAANIGGTSAELRQGDILSIEDLFYGLMLPSGNDASYTLGEYFGVFLYLEEKGQTYKINELGEIDIKKDFPSIKDPMRFFLSEMNQIARELNMNQTNFNNVHGMSMKINISSAFDMGLLTCEAIKHPVLRKICKTKGYYSRIWNNYTGYRENYWENTNKLLDNGFEGVKTGITPNAGGCLAVLYRMDNKFNSVMNKENYIVAVVLASEGADKRFSDAKKLVDWYKFTK